MGKYHLFVAHLPLHSYLRKNGRYKYRASFFGQRKGPSTSTTHRFSEPNVLGSRVNQSLTPLLASLAFQFHPSWSYSIPARLPWGIAIPPYAARPGSSSFLVPFAL